jgi:hypothetical protein
VTAVLNTGTLRGVTTPAAHRLSRRERRAARLASISDGEALDSLRRVSTYISVWHTALQQQADRIQSLGLFSAAADIWLWASALGSLLRCIDLTEHLGCDVTAARIAFAEAVPHGLAARDVLEHLEDYELGIGDQQHSSPGQTRLEFMYERGLRPDEDTGALQADHTLHLQGVGLKLNIVTAQAAVAVLVEAAYDAIYERSQALKQAGARLPDPARRPDLEIVARSEQPPWPED